MREIIKTIGKKSEKIGNTTVSGEGSTVKIKDPRKIVAARDYVSSRGYSGAVDWDGENVIIGGKTIKPVEVRDGKSYVFEDDADKAVSEMEQRNGIVGYDELINNRNEKYGRDEDAALKKVSEREPFSYDYNEDPVYGAYKEKYSELANDAYRRVLNDNNTSVSGASGAVLSEAMAAQYNELRKISDMIPELYDDAYNRYSNEATMNRLELDAIKSVADGYFDRLYKVNKDAAGNLNDANASELEEKQRWIDNARNEEKDSNDRLVDGVNMIKNRVSTEETAMENAITRGFFTEEDEIAIPWLYKYRNGNGSYTIDPTLARLAYEYNSTHASESAKINAKMGR